jgi:chaperonin GroEL (HSP60 family)
VLRAGGVTLSDAHEERHKIQRALSAATSAIEEGWVLGGGSVERREAGPSIERPAFCDQYHRTT